MGYGSSLVSAEVCVIFKLQVLSSGCIRKDVQVARLGDTCRRKQLNKQQQTIFNSIVDKGLTVFVGNPTEENSSTDFFEAFIFKIFKIKS